MKVLVPVEIEDEQIQYILETVIDSGHSHFWFWCEARSKPSEVFEPHEYLKELKGEGIDVYDAETMKPFYEVEVYRCVDDSWTDPKDREDQSKRTLLHYDDFKWGMQIVAKEEPRLIQNLIYADRNEAYDADDCDRIMQYILFGEQIFG